MARPKKSVVTETPLVEQSKESPEIASYGESVPRETLIEVPDYLVEQSPYKDEIKKQSAEESREELTTDSYEEPESVFDEDEQKAIKSGWTPKEAFKGDPDKWRDAKKWNERNNVTSLIEEQKQELARQREELAELVRIMKTNESRNVQLQLTALEKEKEEAIRIADVDKVRKLDEVIYNLKGMMPPANQTSVQNQVQPVQIPREVIEFKARNKWFDAQDDLSIKKTNYAKFLENDLNQRRVNMSLADKMAYIENEVTQIFDGSVKNVSPVETRRAPIPQSKPSGLPDYNALPKEMKRIVESFLEKAEFKAKKDKKPFNKGAFRAKYVKEWIDNGLIDSSGKPLNTK